MNDAPAPLKRIAIIGGGTAGWIAAAMLATVHPEIGIELVESEEIGTIGVGESTIPPFLQLIARLGISESEFIQQCQASYKLGIEFRDWHRKGEAYFHPFGDLGMPMKGGDFYQLWLAAASGGYGRALTDFSPAAAMAADKRFMLPFMARDTPIGGAAYALHVDARRVAAFLRRFAEEKGVTRTEGMVTDVGTDARGFVTHVELKDGRRVAADFFLDCTGFRALLSEKTLGTGFEDWGDYLLCDRAVAVQTENVGLPAPYTLAHAQDAGWRWRIPLQHRTGNGHVYSSRHMSDDSAAATLLNQVEGRVLVDPLPIKFRTGVREQIWRNNVLAIGLSSGFVEPLESTAIHLIYRGIDFFLRFMPSMAFEPALVDEYNRRMRMDYEEIRDFIVLHYATTARDDTPFWRDCAAAPIPDSLAERIALFRAGGTLREGTDELFRAVSWQCVMEGMGIRPARPHPSAARIAGNGLPADLDRLAGGLAQFARSLPTHQQFLARHCPAPAP